MGMDTRTFICLLVSLAATQAHVALTFPPARWVPSPDQSYCLEKRGSSFIPIPPIVGQISILDPQSRRPDRPFSSRNANLDSTSSSSHLVLPTFGLDILFLLFIVGIWHNCHQ